MFYHLPPVGNKIRFSVEEIREVVSGYNCDPPAFLSPKSTLYYASGTAALASAVTAAMLASGTRNRGEQAEVILPAYACPDLVSAVVFSGATPVLVDMESERPWIDLSQLTSTITDNTVAIIGVNLFGISERWEQLCKIAKLNDVVLIEDSAQYFPMSGESPDWHGDLVVFSFGRGKPVSLLGGGAVFANHTELFRFLPDKCMVLPDWKSRVAYKVKACLYNIVISPYAYWLLQAIPFFHLGETRYRPLCGIEAIDRQRLDILMPNICYYQADRNARDNYVKISAMLESISDIVNIPQICEVKEDRRLLRYPLLLQKALRDEAYFRLQQAGLGASVMYPASLDKINDIDVLLKKPRSYECADIFASQILTLPLHSQVSDEDIEKMKIVLMDVLGSDKNMSRT